MDGTTIPYKMLSQDAYSSWLGIEIISCEIGILREHFIRY